MPLSNSFSAQTEKEARYRRNVRIHCLGDFFCECDTTTCSRWSFLWALLSRRLLEDQASLTLMNSLLERLKRAEDLLRSKGIASASGTESTPSTELGPSPQQSIFAGLTPDPASTSSQSLQDAGTFLNKPPFSSGKLIQDEGRARFIDNNLWSSLSEEFHPKDAIDEYSSEDEDEALADESNEFVLGLTPSSTAVQHLHPAPDNIFKLWQVFLDNVNPLTKIIHYPSLQEKLVRASTNLENIPRGLEALMFSIYYSAAGSLDETECEKMFGEAKKSLLSRYRHGARRALARARFLGTADLVVLQAFTLYVV